MQLGEQEGGQGCKVLRRVMAVAVIYPSCQGGTEKEIADHMAYASSWRQILIAMQSVSHFYIRSHERREASTESKLVLGQIEDLADRWR